MKRIVVIGANPAWQKGLVFEHFQYGEVNRAREMTAFASGKGINCSRAMRIAGDAAPELVQFTGGDNGLLLTRGLAAEDIGCRNIPTAAATRCCTTCLCEKTGTMTELIEPSPTPSEAEESAFITAVADACAQAAGMAICGTLPGQLSGRIYREAVAAARRAGIPVLIDAWRDIRDMLAAGAQTLLKINKEELYKLSGGDRPVPETMRALIRQYGLSGLGITDGPNRAYWGDADTTIHVFTLSKIDRVVSPLGCGDTVSGVTIGAYAAGATGREAFAAGLAAAQANCLNILCGSYRKDDAERFRRELRCREWEENDEF